jgi:Mg-chelatase subunit ChlI
VLVAALLVGGASLSAQLLPERGLVREGNEQFRRHNYYTSLNRYNEALEHAPGSYEAQYNRANAYMHLMFQNPQDSTLTRENSNRYFESIINNEYITPEQRAEVLRNIGESLFLQQEYESALNAFRESLKLNADDQETKRNYVLTKRIVDQKRHAEQQQQQNNQDQQQQQDNQNNQNNQDQQNNENNSEGDNNKDNQQNQPNNDQQQPNDQNQEGDNPEQEQQPQEENNEGDDEREAEQPNLRA